MGFLLVGIAAGLFGAGLAIIFGEPTAVEVAAVYIGAGLAGFGFALALSIVFNSGRKNSAGASDRTILASEVPDIDALEPPS